jgi:hypothetical protein
MIFWEIMLFAICNVVEVIINLIFGYNNSRFGYIGFFNTVQLCISKQHMFLGSLFEHGKTEW